MVVSFLGLNVWKRDPILFPICSLALGQLIEFSEKFSPESLAYNNDSNDSSRKIQLKFKLSTMEINLIFRKSFSPRLFTFKNNDSIYFVPTLLKILRNITSFDLLGSINEILV